MSRVSHLCYAVLGLTTMSEKTGAYATPAKDTDFRRKWDKEEYAEKARKKDEEERERMKENEERTKQGLHCIIDSLEYRADCE